MKRITSLLKSSHQISSTRSLSATLTAAISATTCSSDSSSSSSAEDEFMQAITASSITPASTDTDERASSSVSNPHAWLDDVGADLGLNIPSSRVSLLPHTDSLNNPKKQRRPGESIYFDGERFKEYVTGFRKRKAERRSLAQLMQKKKQKLEKVKERKERKQALLQQFGVDEKSAQNLKSMENEQMEDQQTEIEMNESDTQEEQTHDHVKKYSDAVAHVTVTTKPFKLMSDDEDNENGNENENQNETEIESEKNSSTKKMNTNSSNAQQSKKNSSSERLKHSGKANFKRKNSSFTQPKKRGKSFPSRLREKYQMNGFSQNRAEQQIK